MLTTLALLPLSAAYWFNRVERSEHELQHQLDHAGEQVAAHLQGKLHAIELVLRGVRGFVEGSSTVTPEEFHAFVTSLQIEHTTKGLLSVAYVPWVPGSNDGGSAPIQYIEPALENNWLAQGRDVFSIPAAREAALRAQDTRSVSLSRPLTLGQYAGTDEAAAFVMYVPVFSPERGTGPMVSQSGLLGWAGARFRLMDLMVREETVLHDEMYLQFFEADRPVQEHFLVGWLNQKPAGFLDGKDAPYSHQGRIEFGGQHWTYTVTPTPAYLRAHSDHSHHWFAVLGLLLSLAAGTIVWLLMTGRDRARGLALGMTQELRQLSAELEGTLNAIPDSLFELDDQGRFLAARISAQLGSVRLPEELVGKRVHDILPAAAADGCMQAIAEAGRSGCAVGQQIQVPVKGEVRWFELSVARKSSGQQADARFIMLSRDITDKVKALQQLQESEHALTEAQRIARIGHFWVNVSQHRWTGSPSVCELLGLSPDHEQGLQDVALLVELRHRTNFLDACTTSGAGAGVRFEFELTRASDGAKRWMLMCGQSRAATDPLVDAHFFTLQDVTEKRRSEEQLKLLEQAVSSLNDMILITEAEPVDEPGPRIVYVNDAFERMTGYERHEALGRTPRILQGPDTARAELDRIHGALKAWEPVRAELINYTKDQRPYWVELMIQPICDERGWYTHWVSVERDVTERRAAAEKVHQLAYFDALTSLPNRAFFLMTAKDVMARYAECETFGAALLIDLDNFKLVNDHWGHDQGDSLLQQVAQRLREALSPQDVLARLGGDEFILMVTDLGTDKAEALQRVEALCVRVLSTLSQQLVIGDREYFTSASMGVVVFGESALSVEELLSRADSAMYSAKDAGRNTYRFFDSGLQAQIAERVALEADLHQSIERQELYLLYQPQVDSAGQVIGAEALCRWSHGNRGTISPAQFIPLAESCGFIQKLGQWVLETACNFLARWRSEPGMEGLTLSVNVSARQFHHPDFVSQVKEALERSHAQASQLKLELTESIFAEDIDDIVAKMQALEALGVCFSLDDFGTGYSSLSYLKKLPLAQLKIDQSFVRDVLLDASDEAIVRTVIALGESLGLRVIAEGVESEQQREFLFRNGCLFYQGYLFGRPMPEEELLALVRAKQASRLRL